MDVEDLSGKTLGHYELRERIEKGGMGAVYRALDTNLEREVAVKVLSPELASQPEYILRFEREAKIVAKLEHPHIVPIHDYGIQDGYCYIAMRWLAGGSLHERLKENSQLPLEEIATLLEHMASALDYAHSKGVLHRDVKAKNVMFDHSDTPFLVDFGIAKLLRTTSVLTQDGVAPGTYTHMAPEQWRGDELTPAADQYALGVMMYAAVTGRMPFDAPTLHALMYKHLLEKPAPPQQWRPDLPEAIKPVLDRALAKDPRERYPNAQAFAEAFRQAVQVAPANIAAPPEQLAVLKSHPADPSLDGETTPAPPPSPPLPPEPAQYASLGHRRHVWRRIFGHAARRVAGTILLILLLGLLLMLASVHSPSPVFDGHGTPPAVTPSRVQTKIPTSLAVAVVTTVMTPSLTTTVALTHTPAPTNSATQTPTRTPTATPTRTATATQTSTATLTATLTRTASRTPTLTPSVTPTATRAPGTTTVNGVLTSGHPIPQTTLGQAGDLLTVVLTSYDFDTYVILKDPSGSVIAEDDDCGTVSRSCLRNVRLPEDGTYTIVVDSFDRRSGGEYTLEITVNPAVTATPTHTPTPTPTTMPTLSPISTTPCPGVTVTTSRSSVNIRGGPDADTSRVTLAYDGECLTVIGRKSDNSWLQIETTEGRRGWILANLTDVEEGDLTGVPVTDN